MATATSAIENDISQTHDNAAAAADAENVLAQLKAGEPTESITSELKSEPKPDANIPEDQKLNSETKLASDGRNEVQNSDKANSNGDTKSRDSQQGRGTYRGRHLRPSGHRGDLTALPETDDPHEIRRQVEFYFSDSNLPLDKFLLLQVGGSENRPVDLKLIHSFKRMRRFKPFSAIVSALKDSTLLDVIEDEGENIKIRRKSPLPDTQGENVRVFEDRTMPRSIYAKGFGDEAPTTQFDIEAFFAPYGPTNAVRLRRTEDKTFKGSVFVEFDSPETADKFLKSDPKPKWEGKELLIMSKKAYVDGKAEDIRAGKIKPRPFKHPLGKRKADDGNGLDEKDWRQRREEDQKRGFKKGGGGKGYGSKGGRGGNRADRDSRGVRQIKDSSKDPETVAALAKAKAIVEEEEAKEAKKDGMKTKPEAEITTTKDQQTAEATKADTNGAAAPPSETATTASRKRSREEDGEYGTENGEPDAKKVATAAEQG